MVVLTLLSIAIDVWRSRNITTESIPSIAVSTLKGGWIDINKMSQNKPVLVYFWATWCPVCDFVSPSVNWLSDNYQVVSVAITSGDTKRLKQYMQYKEYRFDVINDATGSISRQWGVSVTPSVFIVNKGEISSITTGATTPMGLWLRLIFA